MTPRHRTFQWPMLLAIGSIVSFGATRSDYLAGSLPKLEPQAVYAPDPRDSWNRIFYLLFTRKVECRLTDDFGQPGPRVITAAMGDPKLSISAQSFERIESGDRAIDPLYPNFFNSKGADSVLVDPTFSELKQALQDALAQTRQRPPLQRALMQADAWAAYDRLSSETQGQFVARARELLPMLAQFIRKLALTPHEIAGLPRNYLAAQSALQLPTLFDDRSGWIEVEWFRDRAHDFGANHRRAARVFLKPTAKPQDFLKEINRRIRRRQDPLPDPANRLDAAAILTELLLIDSSGHVVPSPLTYELELRRFEKDSQGKFQRTSVTQYELSRKSLLADPTSGGLVPADADQPAYLPAAGNDYSFASPIAPDTAPDTPVLVTLRRRCQSCHGDNMTSIFTLEMKLPPDKDAPRARQLPVLEDRHANYVAEKKTEERTFKSLQW